MHVPIARIGNWLDLGFSFGNVHVTLGSLLAAIVALAAFIVFSMVLRHGLRRYAARQSRLTPSTLYAFERLLHYLLVIIGVLVAIGIAGIPMAQMAVFAGALGVGLGFGLQAIFNNFISGVILLFDRSLKIGDFVELKALELQSGVHGHVREIRMRYTRITTNDGVDILVPNSEFVSGRVVNWTVGEAARRMRVRFRVALDSDFGAVQRAGMEAAAAVGFTLAHEGARAPRVWIEAFGDSALECELVVWLNADATLRPSTARAAYNQALLEALDRHGITIPYAQRSVRVIADARDGGEGTAAAMALAGRVPGRQAGVARPGEHDRTTQDQRHGEHD